MESVQVCGRFSCCPRREKGACVSPSPWRRMRRERGGVGVEGGEMSKELRMFAGNASRLGVEGMVGGGMVGADS